MQKTLFTISLALFAFIGAFFSAASEAHAQIITLPEHFSYEGLTFYEPLTYTNPQQAPVKKNTLTFQIPEKLSLKQAPKKEITSEIVLFPTITTAMTLPVLPTQQPPYILKDDAKQTPTPSPNVSPTKTALPTPPPTTNPTISPVAASIQQSATVGGLDAEKLFAMSNAFRQERGLPPFQKDERACSLAASRAPEIAAEVASGNMHAGLRARALPYWNSENIISMRTEEAAFNWWVNDKIHHDAIVGNYTYSCVACSGNSCAQEFTNFQPK